MAIESSTLGAMLAESLIEYLSASSASSTSSASAINSFASQEEVLNLYGVKRVPRDIEFIMLFKKKYMDRLDMNSKVIILTPYENRRRDAWSLKIFGSVDFAYMFDVLIPNVEYAKNHGYEVLA